MADANRRRCCCRCLFFLLVLQSNFSTVTSWVGSVRTGTVPTQWNHPQSGSSERHYRRQYHLRSSSPYERPPVTTTSRRKVVVQLLNGNEDEDQLIRDESLIQDTTQQSVLQRLYQQLIGSNPLRAVLFSILMTLSGALLGPLLDSDHSRFGVLQYDHPITMQLWGSNSVDHPALITTYWVPFLFGVAGFLIGWLYMIFDILFQQNENDQTLTIASSSSLDVTSSILQVPPPSPPKILIGIAMFTFQYWLSGYLYQSGMDRTTILYIMSILATIGFTTLDNSPAGFWTSTFTAIGGPLIEMGLISYSNTPDTFIYGNGYHYADLGETGYFPLWIIPVYFLGGPANGNLARGYWSAITTTTTTTNSMKDTVDTVVDCKVCDNTRRTPCPNCDGVGTYMAMGGRTIPCTSCKGRGYVICRTCFHQYDDDPYDIENIRNILSKMPD